MADDCLHELLHRHSSCRPLGDRAVRTRRFQGPPRASCCDTDQTRAASRLAGTRLSSSVCLVRPSVATRLDGEFGFQQFGCYARLYLVCTPTGAGAPAAVELTGAAAVDVRAVARHDDAMLGAISANWRAALRLSVADLGVGAPRRGSAIVVPPLAAAAASPGAPLPHLPELWRSASGASGGRRRTFHC